MQKKKVLKSFRKETYFERKKLNNLSFLIRKHRGQKKMVQYFSSAERKDLSTQNLILSENIQRIEEEINISSGEGKLKRICC